MAVGLPAETPGACPWPDLARGRGPGVSRVEGREETVSRAWAVGRVLWPSAGASHGSPASCCGGGREPGRDAGDWQGAEATGLRPSGRPSLPERVGFLEALEAEGAGPVGLMELEQGLLGGRAGVQRPRGCAGRRPCSRACGASWEGVRLRVCRRGCSRHTLFLTTRLPGLIDKVDNFKAEPV